MLNCSNSFAYSVIQYPVMLKETIEQFMYSVVCFLSFTLQYCMTILYAKQLLKDIHVDK